MKTQYASLKAVLLTLSMLFLAGWSASAQQLQVKDLVSLRAKSLDEIKSTLASKGWVYAGRRNDGESLQRYSFNAGDGKNSLAAVVYVDVDQEGNQALEYSVFRKSLISQLQNNLKTAAMKFIRKDTLSDNVELKLYEKNGAVLVTRGSAPKEYFSVKVHSKHNFKRLQAAM